MVPKSSIERQSRSRHLNDEETSTLMPYIPLVDLKEAILHFGHVPWYLPRRFGAIVRGCHVYLRPGVYLPLTPAGIALLGHELTHVGQYRTGMTAVRYLCAALRGYRNNRYEKAAFTVQTKILADLTGHACAPSSNE